MKSRLLALMLLMWGISSATAQEKIDLTQPMAWQVKILSDFSGAPDADGVLARYEIVLPGYDKGLLFAQQDIEVKPGNRFFGVVFSPEFWPAMKDGFGQMMLVHLRDGRYLAFLPLAGEESLAWLAPEEDGILALNLGNLGTAPVEGDQPLYACAVSVNPYEACQQVWREGVAANAETVRSRLRGEKPYPEVFQYLGWCSYEGYRHNISESIMIDEVMKGYRDAGLPVRYLLIDGGHAGGDERGVGPHPERFPHGYKNIVAAMKGDPFQWLGLHYTALGTNRGILAPPSADMGAYEAYTVSAEAEGETRLFPADSPEAMRKWWEYFTSYAAADGAKFIKVDFLKHPMQAYFNNREAWGPDTNAARAAARFKIAMEDVTRDRGLDLMNCNGNSYPAPFFARYSNSSRCSEDYAKDDLSSAISHTYNAYADTLYVGQVYWPDHDMFHSCDENAGQLMAVCKAMSGGPIYLSDKPDEAVPDLVKPLCYADGMLPRPLAPAVPCEASLFFDVNGGRGLHEEFAPLDDVGKYNKADSIEYNVDGDRGLYKAFAPLNDQAVAVHIMNLSEEPGAQTATLALRDYENGGAMIQPWPGLWTVPEEGLYVYDVLEGAGHIFGGEEKIELSTPLAHKLLQLTPIRDGWALIGRTDKYLCGATAEIVSSNAGELTILLRESGPFALYSAKGRPIAENVVFADAGGGLYKADMPIGAGAELRIRRP